MEYIVYDERYFCRPINDEWREKEFFSAVVMRADVEKGGEPMLEDRVILAEAIKVRYANESDIERFKIVFSFEQKEINVFYAVDNIDNTKTTLFAVEGKASKEMIRKALIEFDYDLQSDDEERFEKEVERAYSDGECSFGDTEFFFDTTILYYE